jgi:hypothetical protein
MDGSLERSAEFKSFNRDYYIVGAAHCSEYFMDVTINLVYFLFLYYFIIILFFKELFGSETSGLSQTGSVFVATFYFLF